MDKRHPFPQTQRPSGDTRFRRITRRIPDNDPRKPPRGRRSAAVAVEDYVREKLEQLFTSIREQNAELLVGKGEVLKRRVRKADGEEEDEPEAEKKVNVVEAEGEEEVSATVFYFHNRAKQISVGLFWGWSKLEGMKTRRFQFKTKTVQNMAKRTPVFGPRKLKTKTDCENIVIERTLMQICCHLKRFFVTLYIPKL
ncbi:hypothetical protein KSP40_PGU017410 [Platanthera guangdongensis]|uniref:Uncharacterized protein n=1 Tax=Platanthera guangdongensis TaxID=2320717 RepID=A0ABR2MEB4_9ASPA